MSLEQRLASAIDYQGPSACWLWKGTVDSNGYGRISLDHRNHIIHRLVYEMLVGPIPHGLTLDHLCRTRACCNPAHLEPVTNRENTLRGVGITAICAAKTHCKWGHEFTAANTYRQPSRPEQRGCKQCWARRSAERRARLRAAAS